MVKIELLIPLSYFGIVRTSSTETVKIAHFVFFFFWSFVKPRALTMTFIGTKTTPIWSTRSCASSFVLLKSFWNTFCHTITKQKQVHSIADLAFLFVAKRSPRNFRSKFKFADKAFLWVSNGARLILVVLVRDFDFKHVFLLEYHDHPVCNL